MATAPKGNPSPLSSIHLLSPPLAVTKQAQTARKAALIGTHSQRTKRHIVNTRFTLPKTLKLARKPKYQRKSVASTPSIDEYAVLRAPLNTESAMRKIEDHNTLVFLCDVRANKHQIKAAVKKLYSVDAVKVNTLIRPDGVKKAFVRLAAEQDALEVAGKIGFI